MMITVYDQWVKGGKLTSSSSPSLVAGLEGSTLKVAGKLPPILEDLVDVKDLDGLDGEIAVKIFFVLVATKYSGYSKMVREGVDLKKVEKFINTNFAEGDRLAIFSGSKLLDTKITFEEILREI